MTAGQFMIMNLYVLMEAGGCVCMCVCFGGIGRFFIFSTSVACRSITTYKSPFICSPFSWFKNKLKRKIGMVFIIMNCPAFIIIFIYNNSVIISVIKQRWRLSPFFFFLFFFFFFFFSFFFLLVCCCCCLLVFSFF